MDLRRRLVAVDSVIVALMRRCGIATSLDVRLAPAICIARLGEPDVVGTIWDTIEKKRTEKLRRAGHLVSATLIYRLIPLANFGKRAQPVLTDESVRTACCSS
jgi:hypothetical protein